MCGEVGGGRMSFSWDIGLMEKYSMELGIGFNNSNVP